MVINQGRDNTLDPAYFANIRRSTTAPIDEERLKAIEEKNAQQDTKLEELDQKIDDMGCDCDMQPIEEDFINGLTFSSKEV